jgi:hypothetical protein
VSGHLPPQDAWARQGYGLRGVLRIMLRSGIITLRRLLAGRSLRAPVTSDGIGGAVVPVTGSAAAGSGMGVLLRDAGPAAASSATA